SFCCFVVRLVEPGTRPARPIEAYDLSVCCHAHYRGCSGNESRCPRRCGMGRIGPRVSGQTADHAQDPTAVAEKKHQASLEDDRTIGNKYAAQIAADKTMPVSDDKDAIARVQRIGKVLGDLANTLHTVATYGDTWFNTFDYDFKVLKGKDINAFSIPGGH